MAGNNFDVAVVGGGFYGCFVAGQVAARHPDLSIVLLEKENALFARASGTNQGQLHMGYMYSADVELAEECARNSARFAEQYPEVVDGEVRSYFGIHRASEISPHEYIEFCGSLGLPLYPAPRRRYFGDGVIEAFLSVERTFNGVKLGRILHRRLGGVQIQVSRHVHRIEPGEVHSIILSDGDVVTAKTVYNTTFADINPLHDRSGLPRVPIRCEVFLHFLLQLPNEYDGIGIAVIRGRFASALPSSVHGGHLLAAAAFRRLEMSDSVSLSEYVDQRQVDKTHAEAIRECSAYLPALRDGVYKGHVIGTRAAFIDTATGETTSRVTSLLDFAGIRDYHVILGGKVPCLFEALEPALAGIRR
ncbi:FAD-dependent oxidoreductase [Actinocrispum sp. NPDC049592]|uniref:FAD-dependent oxidoreductase n=1 Tax=Actinocrispum sp. NPDC049592 TaxID=3154835 RepID=UPI003440D0F7